MKLKKILTESFSVNKSDDKIINECLDVLFEEAYKRTLSEGFPKSFLKLDTQAKKQISRIYRVGPDSKETEIKPELGTKKPYRDQLVVWVDKNGQTIGYGVGADVRQTYGHGMYRRENMSRAQMQRMAAKAFVVTQDDSIRPKRDVRNKRDMDNAPYNNQFTKRAAAFLKAKEGKLVAKIKPEIGIIKSAYNKYIDGLTDSIKDGDMYDVSDFFNYKSSYKSANKELRNSAGPALQRLAKIGHIFWQMKSWTSYVNDATALQQLVNKVKSAGV